MNCIRCNSLLPNEGPCAKCGWDVEAVIDIDEAYKVGEEVNGRYTIIEALGSGRIGACYKAHDSKFKSDVVLKFIHPGLIPNERAAGKFVDGMRFLLQNNYIITTQVLEVNYDRGTCYFSCEVLEGVPLRDLIENRKIVDKPFTIDEIYPILRQVSAFLIESDAGLHGSLSPDNIWILPGNLKILDVGLVENLPLGAVAKKLTSKQESRGYVAPELAAGEGFDLRTDIYALGVLLGEMTTKAIYDGRPEVFMEANPSLPKEVDGILRRALLEDPDGRYATIEQFMAALSKVAGHPVPSFNRPWSKALEESGLVRVAPPPDRGGYYPEKGQMDVIEATAQVVMAEVIESHYQEITAVTRIPTKDSPNATKPPTGRITIPPPRRNRRSHSSPSLGEKKPTTDAKESSSAGSVDAIRPPVRPSAVPSPQRSSTIPPPARPSVTPLPVRPSVAPPHPRRAEISSTTGIPRAPAPVDAPSIFTGVQKDVTQEIDFDALEEADADRREVTQKVDMNTLEEVNQENVSTAEAAAQRLETQALEAEELSTAELIKHAQGLDGIDPRFVRAAHKLETERLGSQSKNAAQILKGKGAALNGIDPRFVRAAARLEEAKIGEVASPHEDVVAAQGPSLDESEDDWRKRIAAETSTNEDSVISFIASPIVENASEVQGFPRSRQRQGRNRPPVVPPNKRRS